MANKKKILVMDDEDLVRETARDMLECTGFDVDIAAEGSEAVDKYKKALEAGIPFHAVILDLNVADGLGGIETFNELLNIDKKVKAVLSSGIAEEDIIGKYKEYGFAGSISKPYQLKVLYERLTEIIS